MTKPENDAKSSGATAGPAGEPEHCIRVHLAEMMARRDISLNRLSELTGIHVTNLSRLKNGHIIFIRLQTLSVLCRELKCQPGDLLGYSGD